MSVVQDGKEAISAGDDVTINPHECSVKGGERIILSFSSPLPKAEVLLVFHGSYGRHEVASERNGSTMLCATIPAHKEAEVVDLSVCYHDDSGEQRTLYKTKFAYTVDEKQFMAELLVQSVSESGVPLQYSLLLPLLTAEALREFDYSLTEALRSTELPVGWTLVGYGDKPLMSMEDCRPRETLLHFAARHSFNSLARHLLTLPGAEVAALLPNDKGDVPLALARTEGNEGLVQLLTMFNNQTRSPSITDSPLHGLANGALEPRAGSPGEGEGDCEGMPWERNGASGDVVGRKRNREELQKINDEWKLQVKRHKTSTCSLGHSYPSDHVVNGRNRAPSPPLRNSSSVPPKRRSSIAIMDSTNHPHLGRSTPIGSINFNVNDPSVAEMDRLRKASWSRVVGNCESRSVGTGLNELDRIIAEDSLQEKVDAIQSGLAELEQHKEKAKYSLLTLNHDQLDLLYRLSSSCPALNKDEKLVSYSRALSATTSPRFGSPFSEEDDDRQSLDLVESCSPQFLYQPLEGPFSGHSETSFSRTNTDSSTSSRMQKSHLIPEVITTDCTDLSQGATTDDSSSVLQQLQDDFFEVQRPRSGSEATLVVQRNGNSNNGDGGVDDGGSNDDNCEVAVSWLPTTKSLSSSLMKLSEELGAAEEGEGEDGGSSGGLDVEGGVTASVSAPDLLVLTQEEVDKKASPATVAAAAVVESVKSSTEVGAVSIVSSDQAVLLSQESANEMESRSQHDTSTVDDSTEREWNTSIESSKTEASELQDSVRKDSGAIAVQNNPSTPTVQITRRGTSQRRLSTGHKKRHRRSLSTSEVEVSSPKDHAHFQAEGSDEDEEGSRVRGYSTRETSGVCMQSVIIESNQSLTLDQTASIASGCSSLRGDDRSRASSFLTNETSSQRESEGSSDEDTYLSAKESISRTSLDQASTPQKDMTGTNQPEERENGGGPEGRGSVHQLQLPNEDHDGVILRRGSKKHSLKTAALNRYSADFQITNIDEFISESSEGESNHCGESGPAKRRHRSTDVVLTDNRSEDHKASHGKPPSGNSSSSPGSSQDQLHPNRSQKMSVDSVFEHDLSPSDVDVRMTSDDSISLSQSFESSGLQHSLGSASESGSPRAFGKRRKSPHFLSGRKILTEQSSSLDSLPRNKKPGGLTKDDVGPTIQALRGLMKSPTSINSNWSDDSDTTIGPDTVQHGGTLNAPKTNLQRTGSNLSDSIVYQQQKGQFDSTGRDIPRSASPEQCGDCTSLDSPLSARRVQPHLTDTPIHPPSPLFQSHSRSPILGRNNTPSPTPSPGPGTRPGLPAYSKLRPTMSFDEGVLHHNEYSRSILASSEAAGLENHETLAEVPEEEFESSLDVNVRKPENTFQDESHAGEEVLAGEQQEQRSRMMKLFGMRSSTRTKKLAKEKPVRPKSGKQRLKSEASVQSEEEIVFVAPEFYPRQSNLHRSESMQVNLGKSRTAGTSRRESEGTVTILSTKQKHHHGSTHSLMTLKEVQAPSQEPLPTSDSDQEGVAADEEPIVPTLVSAVSHPELALCEEQTWDKTVDRRVYKKLNKAERERQAIIFELLQTEKSHLRALNVLKLIFRQNIMKIVSEEVVGQLFPELDNLLEISEGFITRLEERKDGSRQVNIFGDISDVLMQQFSGDMKESMLHAFGGFCSVHLTAAEIYKEHMKKKHFSRLMIKLHILKECNRLTLPDYYTRVTQRLAKLVTLHQRLVRKTEALKLEHTPQLKESMHNLQVLVTAVDQMVEDHKNQMELQDIQGKLEISVPKSAKGCDRKKVKSLNLMAQERKLKKRGEAQWKGHGKHLSVHVVLVTDLLVFLTERDQKYHLAALQDLKPPVIRLYDLHVRLNAAVKSGVQLLLLEQGEFPEMFRLEFQSKKEAKGWEATLNSAVEVCKEKGLKCEFFGVESILSGDEERRSEEKEGDSEGEGEEQGLKKNPKPPLPNTSPSLRRWQRARESLDLAIRLLGGSSLTADTSTTHRHPAATAIPTRYFKESPRNRSRAHTTVQRPKTFYDDIDGAAAGGGEHGAGGKVAKTKNQKKKVERSKTFRDKDKEKDKDKGGSEGGESWRIPEQQYVECVTSMKDSLEEMMNDVEEKNSKIARLQKELEALKEFQKAAAEETRTEKESPVVQRPSRNSSPRGSPQQRPHSYHVDSSEDHPGKEGEEVGGTKENENKTSDTGT